MAVNESIYGSAEQWINSAFTPYATNKNKVAYFAANQSRLENGVAAGKISYSEPIDKSLSYCGLGTESALSHVGWIWLDEGTNTYKIEEWQDRDITNFAFFQQNDSNIDMSLSPDQLDYTTPMSRGLFWQELQSSWNHNKYLQPYTLINPNNFVLCIYIYATNSTYSSIIEVDYKTYFSTYKVSYPNIIHAYYVPYFNNQQWTPLNPVRTVSGEQETSINTNKRTLCYGQLDNYKPVGKDWDFYSYYFINNVFFGYYSRSPFTIYGKKLAFVFAPESAKNHVQIITTGGDNDYRLPTIQYYDGIEEDILKSIACFGLYFSTDNNVAKTGLLTNNDMYIGILDDNGIGHGRYLRGAATATAPQNNYTDMHQSGYDPDKGDKTKYRNDTQFYAGYGTSSFTKFYALTEAQVNQLSQELYRIANDVPSGTPITEYNMKMFLTNNPIDCIISLKKFPVENIPLATSDAAIYLGAKATNITGKILATPTWVYYFNFRNSNNESCRPIFGDNFLDYEPYTKCKIVIPFCGTVDVPVSYIYQYDDLQIAMVMDFITGACTAYILVNGITIDSITGSCAIDLPVSGIQSATLDSQIHSVANAREKQQSTLGTGLIAGAVSIGIGLATGSLPVAIGGGAAIIGSFMHADDAGKQINYDLSHMETPVKQVTAASGQIAHTYDMRCKMIITRPTIAAEYSTEEYANTIGFACLENGKVQDFQGFTVANIDLKNIEATAYEKQMISNAFAQGVYL